MKRSDRIATDRQRRARLDHEQHHGCGDDQARNRIETAHEPSPALKRASSRQIRYMSSTSAAVPRKPNAQMKSNAAPVRTSASASLPSLSYRRIGASPRARPIAAVTPPTTEQTAMIRVTM